MTDWFLWDGQNQCGPMDQSELQNRIQVHPNPVVVRIWRGGFADWKTAEEAFESSRPGPLNPPPLESKIESRKDPKSRNVFARHWRGEFPLWVSYWVIGILSNIFAFVVVALLADLTMWEFNPTAILSFYLLIWSFLIGLSVWQLIGTWRSASKSGSFWAVFAKVAICLGWAQLGGLLIRTAIPQISEATSIAFMNDPYVPPYTIRIMHDGSEAEISGGIKFGLTSDFEKILNASTGIQVVHLNSVGGRIGEGQKLNALIRSKGLDTYVGVECLSACTLVFAGGQQRILRKGAQLGFHRAAFAGEDQVDHHGPGIERSIYSAAGIDGKFIDRALATKNEDMWRPSEAELLSAGVVTRITDGDEFAMSGRGLTREDWDKGLVKAAPVYRVLKEKYPTFYDEILDIFSKESARGTPQGELIAQARAKLDGRIMRLSPLADDSVLVDFGRLLAEEYRALQDQDQTACYKFASGNSVDESIIRMIPVHLTDRESKLDELIVASAKPRGDTANTDTSWGKILAALHSKGYTAADLRLMADKTTRPSDYSRYCALSIALYQEVTNLADREAAAVLREMFLEK